MPLRWSAASRCGRWLAPRRLPKFRQAGFVVSHIAFALSKDAGRDRRLPGRDDTGQHRAFFVTAEGHRHEGESDQDYGRRVDQGAQALGTAPNGQNLCLNPEAGTPDPTFRTVTGKDVSRPRELIWTARIHALTARLRRAPVRTMIFAA